MANLRSAKFAPGGKALAVAGGNPAEQGTIEIYSWPQATLIQRMEGGDDTFQDVEWLDDKHLAVAGADRTVTLWQVGNPKATKTLRGHSRPVDALSHLRNANLLISAGADQTLRVWNLQQASLARNMNQHTAGVAQLAMRPSQDGLPMVASAAADRTVRFWQPTIGRMVRYARLDAVPLDICWLPDGQRLAAACDDGQLRLITADSVAVSQPIAAIPEGWAYAVAAHPEDGSVAVGGADGMIVRVQPPRQD